MKDKTFIKILLVAACLLFALYVSFYIALINVLDVVLKGTMFLIQKGI